MSARARVVIAEDDDELRQILGEVLGREHAVVALEDGFELADYLELSLRDGKVPRPDLIVSDVQMPGRSGLDVLAHAPGCPVVLISGFADDECQARAREGGVALLLPKPLDLDALAAAVAALLEQRRAAR